MNITDLITIIREDYLDDTFSGWQTATQTEKDDQFLWSDAALLRYINEAQRQACNRSNFLYSNSTFNITLQSGINTYTISPKITQVDMIVYNNKPVVHMSKDDFERTYPEWRTTTGIGTNDAIWLMRGRTLQIHPIPDAVDNGSILYIESYHLPLNDIVSDQDVLVIPEEYHRDLIWWVLYEAYSKQDADSYDKERGLGYLQKFEYVFGEYIPSEVRINQMQESNSMIMRPIDYMKGHRSYYDPDWPS